MHQIGSATGPMLASMAFDRTGSYDGFMLVMAAILIVAGFAVHSISGPDKRARRPVLAANPAAS